MQQTKQRRDKRDNRDDGNNVTNGARARGIATVAMIMTAGCTGAVSWSGPGAAAGAPRLSTAEAARPALSAAESERGGDGEGGGGGERGGGGGGERQTAVMPDLILMTRAEAEEKLRQAGFAVAPELDTFACGSTLGDNRVVELGRVCAQVPVPGRRASTAIPVKLRVQDESPWRGEYRPGHPWFLMVDFAGMEVAAAERELRRLGYTGAEVQLRYVTEPGCAANKVCRTFPEAWARAESSSPRVFYVGAPDPRDDAQARD